MTSTESPPSDVIIRDTETESSTNESTPANSIENETNVQNVVQEELTARQPVDGDQVNKVINETTTDRNDENDDDEKNRENQIGNNQTNHPSTVETSQVNVNIDPDPETEINLTLTLTDILLNQPLLKPIYRLLSKRTGRLRIQRIIYFMGTFSIGHSFLMLISILPSTGLVDSFSSHLDYMRFTLFLNDVTLFTMLNGILALDPPFQLLNYLWTIIYQIDSTPSKENIEIKQWILNNVSAVRKRLYLLIILSATIYLQLIVTAGLDSASNLYTITRLVDIVHLSIDLIGLFVVLIIIYQFLIITIFAQSIFRDISESFKEDKKTFPWNLSSSSSSTSFSASVNHLKSSAEVILSRRSRYCGIIEFTRTANNHWKLFIAIFVLFNFIPAAFQLHCILNKQLDEQQLVELICRFIINILATYIVIVNAQKVNHFSREFYDDLYQLTLRENNDSTRLEALLFLDRVDHGNIGFTLGDSFLITSNLISTLFASLIVVTFILSGV